MSKLKITLLFLCSVVLTQVLYAQNNGFSGYKNFDFIAGEKILFFDDFSNGLSNWNMIEWDIYEDYQKGYVGAASGVPGNWYHMPRKGKSQPKGIRALPNQFTLEYDFFYDEKASEHEGGILNVIVNEKGLDIDQYSYHFDETPQVLVNMKAFGNIIQLDALRENGYEKGIDGTRKIFEDLKDNFWKSKQVYRISLSRNGSHIRLYVNQDKVLDLPNALPPNEVYTLLLCNNSNDSGYYINNVRLATGVPQPDKDLKEKKIYITQNIHFDVNSDRIKPNSYPILKQVAEAIKGATGKVMITGHTDSDGNAASNLDLSKRRAESVKNALVREFGIDASRLETDGKGQTEPIDSNNTVQGKANNRRVAFSIIP
jgi:outer membrane protein OmpA-like peptidoglycan-associated protein